VREEGKLNVREEGKLNVREEGKLNVREEGMRWRRKNKKKPTFNDDSGEPSRKRHF